MFIGHASIDERGKSAGGNAGDQTGKEVCIRTWYNKPWGFVLRCKNPQKAEIMAQTCEAGCNNPHIGYDQNGRNTLRRQAQLNGWDLSRINIDCECDCSSFMVVCAESAGINIPYSGINAPTTSTMKSAFTKTGMFEVLTDSKYTTSPDLLKRGDILVKAGSHTVMFLGNGNSVQNVPKTEQSVQKTEKMSYIVGKTYTLDANLYIREQPFGTKMKFSCITKNAQQHSKFDDYGNAILQKGTEVTCKAISKQTDSTWILIPSGWVCAVEGEKVYII